MNNLKITSYKSQLISSNMYVIQSKNNLIIIDPWCSDELLELIYQNSAKLDYIILTHEHYDHISGVNWLRERFDCKVVCNINCGESIEQPNLNFSKYFDVLMGLLPNNIETTESMIVKPYSCFADITFEKHMKLRWQNSEVELISTPGHSKGSICIVVDKKYLFSGDSLLKDYTAVTRLKGGSFKDYEEKTINFLKSLPPDTIVYPGHYETFRLVDRITKQDT